MQTLHLNLLGKPQVRLGETPLTGFGTAKAEALFYYLAVTGQPHSREALGELLWGDMPDVQAKRNLTTALTSLRKLVDPYLRIEPHSVAFNLDAPHNLDVAIFQSTVEASAALQPKDFERDLAPLRQAVNLYEDDFLTGFYVKNALSFEDWSLERREQLRTLMLQALHCLIDHYGKQFDTATALLIEYTSRLLALEPWQEAVHRQMMILLAQSGQRGAALAQYETCCRILDEELGVAPSAETMALYERLKTPQKPVPHNLPPQPNAFIGRARELQHLTTNLNNPDCRLLNLIGPGGIGKTRLAIKGARHYIEPKLVFNGATFADGVYFVNLAPITIAEMSDGAINRTRVSTPLASAIADAIGFSFYGPTDYMTQLQHHLREKEMLLVLDNFEHLTAGATLLSALLQQATGIKLLITSRERLNLTEEWEIELRGLDFPKEAQGVSHFDSYSAVKLFMGNVQRIRGDGEPTAEQIADIIRICQLVEGVPLALVLAASWMRVLSCGEVVKEIERNLDFLSASQRNIPERHRSLRAVFEHSWQLLNETERAVFRKITVFRDGFDRKAAQDVTGATLPTLTSLVDKSLLRVTSSGRYETHELLRQFATEKLAQAPAEQAATQDAHCRYYAKFLQAREWQLSGLQGVATLTELSNEIDNIRACWYRAIVSGRPVAVTEIVQCAWSLIVLYAWRGWNQEGVEFFGQAATRLKEEIDSTPFSPQKNLAYGQVLVGLGDSYHHLGDLERATELYQQSLLALRQSDLDARNAKRAQGLALHLLGASAWRRGQYPEARKSLTEGFTLFKDVDDRVFEARSTLFLGVIAVELGEYVKAEPLLQEGLQVFKELDEYWYATEALDCLARARHALGKPLTEVRQLAEENLHLSRKAGSVAATVEALNLLGATLNLMGDTERIEAKALLRESVTLCRKLNNPSGMALALYQLGLTTMASGDDQAAASCFHEALDISISTQFTPIILEILVGLATLREQQQALTPNQQELLLTLATLVFNHPASNRQTQNDAARLLIALDTAGLPRHIISAAKERAQAITLKAMVEEILRNKE
ncbi:MAG: tetratricopeptide repeat protein [Anaerolineae bacterium]|nr:tetratricopeptide repeat protein [Anaerolineae bacterium]